MVYIEIDGKECLRKERWGPAWHAIEKRMQGMLLVIGTRLKSSAPKVVGYLQRRRTCNGHAATMGHTDC